MDKLGVLAVGVILGAGGVAGLTAAAAPGDFLVEASFTIDPVSPAVAAHLDAIEAEVMPLGLVNLKAYQNDQGVWMLNAEGLQAASASKSDAPFKAMGRIGADGKPEVFGAAKPK